MTRSLTIDYGDDVLLALGLTPEEFREEAKLLIAVKLYEMGPPLNRWRRLHWRTCPSRCS